LTALFARRGQAFSKHSAIRAALHRDLVQVGLLGPDAARDYDFLMELRETVGGADPERRWTGWNRMFGGRLFKGIAEPADDAGNG
jgi:hypothetical protein